MNGLSVIIPSKNRRNLEACISAIREQHEGQSRVIVVDDGVEWGSARLVDFHVISGIKPFCFARNVNLGIQAAGSDDVLVLNDDALLRTSHGFGFVLQAAAHEHPDYGVIAATCNNVGNQNQWRQNIGLRGDSRMVCFVAVLIPRRTIDLVGLLDERFIHYGCEDDDYCLRVRQAGLKIGIHDGCYVDHGSLTSTFRGHPGSGGDFLPNLKLFIEKWGMDNRGCGRAQSQFAHLFPAA